MLNKKSLPLQAGSMLAITVKPVDTTIDPCDMEARSAFKSLVDMFSLKLYLDMPAADTNPPQFWPSCLAMDPQNPNSSKVSSKDRFPSLQKYLKSPTAAAQAAAQADLQVISDTYQNVIKTGATAQQTQALAELQTAVNAKPGTSKTSSSQLLKDFKTASDALPPHVSGGACTSPPLCGNPPGLPCV